ncbi:MAG: LysR family transcriptional regulator, partial [Myxococcales bacterium]|nr:LysR family transcriptional regulator [Myxococcales bacterium]
PAFRAVAETEHLPSASKEVNLSASALSRAVRLLEDHLGQQLFVREGRQLVLSPAGRVLLAALRDAMRRVDDGLDQLAETSMAGPVRISAPGPYASIFVLPAVQAVTEHHPKLLPMVASVIPDRVDAELRDGSLDIALLDEPESDEGLTVHLLGKLTSGVYASLHHPLARRDRITLDDVVAHPYVGPSDGFSDHFPPHLKRRIGLVVTQLHVAVQACATGNLLAYLPDAVADAYRGDGALVRLPIEVGSARPLYAVHREILSPPSRVLVVRHAIEAAVRSASRMSRPGSVQPPDERGEDAWI